MNFNEKLIDLRKSKGLSQDELGQRLGVSRQTISKWELAQSYPDFQRLVLLSDYFGMSLDALVKDVDVQDVREKGLLIDASFGRSTRSVIIMDSGNVILSAAAPETLAARIEGKSEEEE